MSTMIEAATGVLQGVATMTPLQRNERLSAASGGQVWLKREDLQPVRSYKLRGAYFLMSQLTTVERAAGVICASAGNHGQGVAWSCARLGINARIFIPSTTPRQKRDRMVALGQGHIELVVGGDTYDDASALAKTVAAAEGATMVPAFDDLRTIAGQGTLAPEIVQQLGAAPDVLLIPVGGGGLLSGLGAWFRTNYPDTRLIGVEPAGAPSMIRALEQGRPVALQGIDTFVDGAAVSRAGDLTLPLVAQVAPEMIAVPEGQVCTEMLDMYQVDGIIAEPAGALSSACLRTSQVDSAVVIEPGQTVVSIVSGGNNDVSRYAEIVERSLVHQGRKRYLLVSFPQEPGALRRFLDDVLGPGDDIVHFEYVKRSNRDTGPALVGIELSDPFDFPKLVERLEASNLQAEVLPQDSPFTRLLV
ncbi:threonine ammonia-lyase IlvA [Tessaracoccus sp. SD287]|uniref:threonine ammonia-lyase IlvA n=1 Tax=Tessaracoccus sp. SD287 TaxID=2782008 RepID=UPI001F61E9BB|nr:threonine ammonia-lyase IlvA [Tessaracoccus sp. SD287]